MLPILRQSRAASFIGSVIRTISSNQKAIESDRKQLADIRHMPEFPLIYPDFLQTTVWGRRNALAERLQRRDMLERRVNLDIPEFYVGSIVAVTAADPNLHGRERRFMGICIRRERHGLLHQFTLRNCIEGLGIEVMFELYNPTLRKIEVIQLQKRLDDDLSYLIDALPEYSTFDTRMEVVTHPAGMPVPVNPLKVKMRPPPWCRRWDIMGCNGIEDAWTLQSPYFKRKFHKTKMLDFRKYDIVADYRVGSELEYEMDVQAEMLRFELEKREAGLSKRRILRSVMQR